jgi:Lrp/AsnC family transcriptional regulator for asnA, asnC and gidA
MKDRVDELDMQIMRELQKDARQSFRELAKKMKVAEGTIYNRINKLRGTGVLRGYAPNIDVSKLGYDLTALIGIAVEGGHTDEVGRRIAEDSNVSAVYDVTGDYDAVVIAKFRDRNALNDFVDKILAMGHVRKTYTMVVMDVLKEVQCISI